MTCWSASPSTSSREGLVFSDQTEAYGLIDPLTGMHGHAAIWADVDGDDWLDLYVGTFADRDPERYQLRGADGPSPDRLLTFDPQAGFQVDEGLPDAYSRTSGGVGVDLDQDGDFDLVVSRNYRDKMIDAPSTMVLRNDDGVFTPVADSGLPIELGGRSVGVLDFNGDGLPDLFITEDRWSGGSSVLLRNEGGLSFADATVEAGIPSDVQGLGVATADLNNDGYTDLFISGSNRLFIARGDGTFFEADSSVFRWEVFGDEDDPAGVSVADVNRDGLLDIAIGQHFNSTVDFGQLVPVRLYLNLGAPDGAEPVFEDVTEASGLIGLPTKAPHVELNDFDNDGWPDLLTSASAGDGSTVAIFRNEGAEGSVPRFSSPEGLGSSQYWVAAPSADLDRDGRLDLFLVEWEPALPSLLLRNESSSGHWLEVSVGAEFGFGLGWRIEVFEDLADGTFGDLLGAREITVTQGYSSGVAPIAHFGLGDATSVSIRLTPPGGLDPIVVSGVPADQHIRYPAGCGE